MLVKEDIISIDMSCYLSVVQEVKLQGKWCRVLLKNCSRNSAIFVIVPIQKGLFCTFYFRVCTLGD